MLFDGLSNEQAICLVLAGFYLYESLVWLPTGATAFISHWGAQHTPVGSRTFRIGEKGGLIVGSLFPTASTLLAEGCPIKLAPTGLLVESSHGHLDAVYYDYESLGEIAVDHNVVLSRERALCKLASPLAANALSDLIEVLAAAGPNEREGILDRRIEEAMDEQRAAQHHERFLKATGALRFLSVIFFAFTVAVGLLAVWVEWSWIRMPVNFALMLLVWLALWLAIVIGFGSAQRALYPDNPVFRRQRMLAFLVSPACAMRTTDVLSRDLMVGHDPLAMAQARCSTADFRQFARRSLLELMHPLAQMDGPHENSVRDWFNERMLTAAIKLIQRSGEDVESIIAPPEPLGADAHSYCPRCEMQFSAQDGQCHACGVPLQQFDSAVA